MAIKHTLNRCSEANPVWLIFLPSFTLWIFGWVRTTAHHILQCLSYFFMLLFNMAASVCVCAGSKVLSIQVDWFIIEERSCCVFIPSVIEALFHSLLAYFFHHCVSVMPLVKEISCFIGLSLCKQMLCFWLSVGKIKILLYVLAGRDSFPESLQASWFHWMMLDENCASVLWLLLIGSTRYVGLLLV